jgi:hypothetical protein
VLDVGGWGSAKKATTRPKSVNFDHEIMEIGLICSNLIEPQLLQSWTEPSTSTSVIIFGFSLRYIVSGKKLNAED